MLQHYTGSRAREHLGAAQPLPAYGSDRSGTKVYRFNSLGFRGEEHDPHAKVTIFVCGCSNAFGTGLDLEETWPHRFKLAYAAAQALAPDAVNVLNFSQGGASNDYVARTLLSQCARVRPDLVLAQWTPINRAEGWSRGAPFSINFGLWPGWSLWRGFVRVPWARKKAVLAHRRQAGGYARTYTPELGFANALRNILLVQSFCRAQGIPCAMSWSDHLRLEDDALAANPALAPLVALLDRDVLCDFAIRDDGILVDAAADGSHPGPASNAAFAERLLAFALRRAPVRA